MSDYKNCSICKRVLNSRNNFPACHICQGSDVPCTLLLFILTSGDAVLAYDREEFAESEKNPVLCEVSIDVTRSVYASYIIIEHLLRGESSNIRSFISDDLPSAIAKALLLKK